jgi:hypothetical protein
MGLMGASTRLRVAGCTHESNLMSTSKWSPANLRWQMIKVMLSVEFMDGPCEGKYAVAAAVLAKDGDKKLVSYWQDGNENYYWVNLKGEAYFYKSEAMELGVVI